MSRGEPEMNFTIKGKAKVGRETLSFEKEIEAESEKHAEEVLYSTYGSKHGISRANIEIEKIES